MTRLKLAIYLTIACTIWGATPWRGGPAHADEATYPLSYSGRLTEADGSPVKGKVDLRFQFFRTATEGEPIDQGPFTIKDIALTDGIFQVTLELTGAEHQAIFPDPSTDAFVEIVDITNGRTYPRQAFSPIPYALKVPVDGEALKFDATGKLTVDQLVAKSADGSKRVSLRAHGSTPADTTFTLPSQPEAGKYMTTDASGNLSWASPAGSGDMSKSDYDTNTNDIVDNAEALGGQNSAFYRNATNINAGTLSETYIDANIARDSEVPYKAESDLTTALDDNYVGLGGSTMTGTLDMGSQKITNLPAPAAGSDAATKSYVDGAVIPDTNTNAISECGDGEFLRGEASTTCRTAAQIASDAGAVLDGGQAGAITIGPTDANDLTLHANGDGITVEDGGEVGIGTANPGAKLHIDQGDLRLSNGASGHVQFTTDGGAGTVTYSLPTSGITNGYVLKTDGSGNLTWQADDDSGASPGFDTIATGTNSSATMTVGAGGSIVTGGGAIEATKVKGSGSTTDAVDLATAEVAGTLPEANIHGDIARDSEVTYKVEGDLTTALDDNYVELSGDTMSGPLNMGSQKITNLDTPSAGTDAATKAYVDGAVIADTNAQTACGDGEFLRGEASATCRTAAQIASDANAMITGDSAGGDLAGTFPNPSIKNTAGDNIIGALNNAATSTSVTKADIISGNAVDGGTISSFASTGIDDNADALAITINSSEHVGIGTASPGTKLHVDQGDLRLSNSASGHVQFTTDGGAGTVTYSLPTSGVTNGYVLKTDGSGNLSWQADNTGSSTPGFDAIATGTNTSATMTVGSGGSVVVSGTGVVEATKIKGSGSTTDAVDLGTAEVAGTLDEANIDAAIARDSEITNSKTLCGDGEFLRGEASTTCRTAAQIAADANAVVSGDSAGGDLAGTYPNPTIKSTAGNNIAAALNNAATTSSVTKADIISGDAVDGGTISSFASTGIDDNADANAITIDSSENVGIGVASPGTKLHVDQGDLRLSNAASGHVQFTTDGGAGTVTYTLPTSGITNGYVLKTNGSGALTWQADNDSGASPGFDNVATGTNTSATMTVGSGGSVVVSGTGVVEATKVKGSGSTTDAVDLGTAEVAGTLDESNIDADIARDSEITNSKTLCGDGEFLRGEASTTCRTAAQIASDANAVVSGDSAGGDLAGTFPNPTIKSTAGNNIAAALNNAATTSSVTKADIISGDAIDGGTISSFASTGIDDNADATAITIDSSENVGIGVASPGTKLHVDQGDLRLSNSSSGHVQFTTDGGAGTVTYTLPTSGITNGYVLKTNGSGALTWQADNDSGASPGFDNIATGTNTSATMTVGSGGSVVVSGTGVVEATKVKGSGSTTDAVDLGTAEVAGTLDEANIDADIARDSEITNSKTLCGDGEFLRGEASTTCRTAAQIASDANAVVSGDSAGGDLAGTYPNPTIKTTAGNNIAAALNNAATTSSVTKADIISGDAVDGGTISDFASTGIDDNADALAVTIDSSENVGIGIASPGTKLHVDQGDLRLSNAASGHVQFTTDGGAGTVTYTLPTSGITNGYVLKTNGSGALTWQADNDSGASPGFDAIATGTNTTATMTVGSGGSVVVSGTGVVEATKVKGSGSTTDAVDLGTAEVAGTLDESNIDADIARDSEITNSKTLCGDGEFLRGEASTTCRTAAQIASDANAVVSGDSAGGDLAGTYPNPTIKSTAGNNIAAALNNAATTSTITKADVISGNAVDGGTISSFASTGIDDNADALAMTIDSSENVGIGIASPDSKLHVAGQIKITGGTPGTNKVLTSDANGLATWETPSADGVQIGSIYGLDIVNNSTNSDYQADISAEKAILLDSSDNAIVFSSISETVDLTASGTNGLDTGSEASSTWYYVWLISNGTVIDSLLSTSSTAPTMPSGYTYKVFAGAMYNKSDGHLRASKQIGTEIYSIESDVIVNSNATSYTSVALASYIPPIASEITVSLECYPSGGAGSGNCSLSTNGTDESARARFIYTSGSGDYVIDTLQPTLPITTSQTIWVKSSATAGYYSVRARSFSIDGVVASASGGGGSDNLGNHTLTENLVTGSNYISNDGDDEGLSIDSAGNVGIGTNSPATALDVNGTATATTFDIGLEIVTNTVSSGSANGWHYATCTGSKKALGGSCQSSNGAQGVETTIDSTNYGCYKYSTNTWTIKVVCADVE